MQSGTTKLELVTEIQQIRQNETKSSICIRISLYLVLFQNETHYEPTIKSTMNNPLSNSK